MQESLVTKGALAALIATVFFIGGLFIGQTNAADASFISRVPLIGDGLDSTPDSSVDFVDFWKTWNALNANFMVAGASSTPPSVEKRLYGAMQGLTASYDDPYTVFFPPVEAKRFSENIAGNFGGIGAELDVKNGVLTVVAPLKDTPAYRAGIKAGDLIIKINGESTEGLSIEESVGKIRGPKGTTVRLTLFRDGKSLDVPIVRDTIIVPESEDELDPKSGVYRIALFQFTATSADLFSAAFDRFNQSGSNALILDLRGNPGGYLESAVLIASHFMPEGATVVSEDFGAKAPTEVHSSAGYMDAPKDLKMVVLIDGGSASASEILAGALQDAEVATLIGTRSFGKGSVQQLIEIGEASLKVTVAHWLTPSGRSISEGGLTPDIEVEFNQADLDAKRDPQMERAIQFLTTGK